MKPITYTAIVMFFMTQVALAESDKSRSILRVYNEVFHGGEAPLRPGAGWLALVRSGTEWHLEPAKLTGSKARDEIVDGNGVQPSGVRITANPPSALAYLRHPTLRVGQVPSAHVEEQFEEDDMPRLDIPIDGTKSQLSYLGRTYQIRASTRIKTTPEAMGRYTLTVTVADKSPLTLTDEEFRDDDAVYVVWAGDLNHDGFLDFVIETSWHNGEFSCWYLSNSGSRLSYRKIGCHDVSGC